MPLIGQKSQQLEKQHNFRCIGCKDCCIGSLRWKDLTNDLSSAAPADIVVPDL